MKFETLNWNDTRIKKEKPSELFVLQATKEILTQRFGQPTKNGEWILLLTFEQIGTIKSKNPDKDLMLSLRQDRAGAWSVHALKENQDLVFQFLRDKKIC